MDVQRVLGGLKRARQRYTLKEIEAKTGIKRATLHTYERGTVPGGARLATIQNFLIEEGLLSGAYPPQPLIVEEEGEPYQAFRSLEDKASKYRDRVEQLEKELQRVRKSIAKAIRILEDARS